MSADKPDPLKPADIPGQNPATPERMPGHTGHIYPDDRASAGNEEELGGRPAFLFAAGAMCAISLDSAGANLPPPPKARWTLQRQFTLGVRDAAPLGLTPEPIIRGILVDGYYAWRPDDPSRGAGTS